MKKAFLAGLFLLAVITAPFAQDNSQNLFEIGNSESKNVVYYEARVSPDGSFAIKNPIHAYWILWAKDSTGNTREELNLIEEKKAYGVRIQQSPKRDLINLSIVGFPVRPITVALQKGKAIASTEIGGRFAALQKILLHICPDCFFPKVYFAELFGTDLATGEKRWEKVYPSGQKNGEQRKE
jgi:hypothetical protein